MDKIINKIKEDTKNNPDIIIRDLVIKNKKIYLVFNEVLCNGAYINDFILKNLIKINNSNNLINKIYNKIPTNNIKKIIKYNDIIPTIFQGFTIIIIDNIYIAIETRATLDKGISTSENEVSIIGPNEAFTENYNTNLGLIRKRIRTNKLAVKNIFIGKQTKTKIGICYMENIASKRLLSSVYNKIKKINIDGVIDTGYIKEIITNNEKIFPTSNITERPDMASQALLEGKIVIIVDNSPKVVLIPTFFIDLFHTSDDYYQKPLNISFIRLIRFIAFLISIFLPSFYISVTTLNSELIPINLLTNFASQRLGVPFPGFIEALIMIICFEILRESDNRSPSKVGTSVSILGGLVLGEAAVSAGIISPIMIIVIAISMISGILFTSNSLIYSIRYYRILILILSAFFGLYGLFIGMMFLIIKLSSISVLGYPYMAPISPFIKSEIKDSFVKITNKNTKYRNPLLAKKNIIRGHYEKN